MQKVLGLTPVWRVVEFFSESLVILEFDFFFFFFLFAFKRTNSDRLSVSQERHAQNPAYQGFQDQQLQRRSCIENLRDGLADWFVIRHTRDEALSSDLFSKYYFMAADATQVGASLILLKNNTEIKRAIFPARRPNESQENDLKAIILFEASRVRWIVQNGSWYFILVV